MQGYPRWPMALGLLLALLCGGVGGWTLAGIDTGPQAPGYREFDAIVDTVERVDSGGLWSCLSPLDPTVLARLGQVCGRVFLADGSDAVPSRRVHVEWFSIVTTEDEEAVDALNLSPPEG